MTALAIAGSVAAPELPRARVDTTLSIPSSAPIRSVKAGQDFKAALAAAQPGDVIELEAGATFYGSFTLPMKSGSDWIYIRSSAHASLPPAGQRVTPAHASLMPKIVTQKAVPSITAASGAHHYRFIGIEIATESALNYNLVLLGSSETLLANLPHHLIFDRCYIHARPTDSTQRGIGLNSAESAVIDSYISDIHEAGFDTQAVGGWNGSGPYKISNNYLEASGENVMFGGADPKIPNLVPSDIEITSNYMAKPLSWYVKDPSYAGHHWTVKNLFELKNAQRVLIQGNILENCWGDAQTGFAILFTPRGGAAPWTTVADITLRNNIIRHVGSGISLLGMDDGHVSQRVQRLVISNNLMDDIDGAQFSSSGRIFQLTAPNKPNAAALDIEMAHNTCVYGSAGNGFITAGDTVPVIDRFVFRDNLTNRGQYGLHGSGQAEGTGTLNHYFLNWAFMKNAIFGGSGSGTNYPADNFFAKNIAQVQFVDSAAGNYRLAASSPYRNAASDGSDIGVNMDVIEKSTAGCISGVWPVSASASHTAKRMVP